MAVKVYKRIEGLEQVLTNLNRQIAKIEKVTLVGLIDGVIIIRRDMDKTAPVIPVDQGNLRASWFVITSSGNAVTSNPKFSGRPPKELHKIGTSYNQAVSVARGMVVRSNSILVVFGFGAYYAGAIHEKVGAKFKRQGAGAKFMENSIDRNSSEVLQAIDKRARNR